MKTHTVASNLDRLLGKIAQSFFWRHFFFLSCALISILFAGYYIGTYDQVIHLPYLKKFVDDSLYPGNAFFEMRFTHYSYFWLLLKPLLQAHILEVSIFLLHIFATYLTFWSIWRLSTTLFHNPKRSLLIALLFVFPHLGFAMFQVIEFSFLNRTFVLPFLLIAIMWYVESNYLASFFILGLMYNLHVVSVNFVLGMFFFDWLLRIKEISHKKYFLGFMLFLVGAFPVLQWKFGSSPVDYRIHSEWYTIISKSMLNNIFYLLDFPNIGFTLSGVASIVLYYIARKASTHRYDKITDNFMLGSVIVIIISIITSYVYPVTIIIQLQIARIGIFTMIFGYIYFIHYLLNAYKKKEISLRQFVLTFWITFLGILAILPLFFFYFYKKFFRKNITVFIFIFVFIILPYIISYISGVWRPAIHIYPKRNAWYDVQIWAKQNTPKNTIFITPPQIWWLYESDWKVFSERSSVVTFSELLEAAFSPDYIKRWKVRFEDVVPGAISSFDGDVFGEQRTIKKIYESRTIEDLRRIGKKYGATYVVVQKPKRYMLPIVYENSKFIIYKLFP